MALVNILQKIGHGIGSLFAVQLQKDIPHAGFQFYHDDFLSVGTGRTPGQ
jgi:hypothetical protein